MSCKLLRCAATVAFTFLLSLLGQSQNCIPTGINGTVFNLSCNQACSDLNFQIPHIKGTSDYVVSSIAYNPYPFTLPASNELTGLYADDVYSPIVNMPFSFCFYDSVFNSCVVGSNGLLTFDIANAAPCGNSYQQSQPIPYASSNICSPAAAYYPKAAVMGMFTDLYPVNSASPQDKKIAWHIEGSAPCRKFVLNYYHVGMFGAGTYSPGGTNCNSQFPTTLQIVLHESTGVIEVFIQQKNCNATSTFGANAILGLQDWTRTKAVWAPNKNATVWNESNTGYRFTPSGAGSRYSISQLFTLGGTLIATADTATTVAGMLDLEFPNVCVPSTTNTYVVRTTFTACDNPAVQLITNDTITVNITGNLNATGSGTNTGCGAPSGTITITVPPGSGASPYTYVLDGGPPVVAPSPYTFNNVGAGLHTIIVTDATGSCTSTVQVTVNQSGVLAATATPTGTTCAGANNGTISVIPTGGTAPFTFTLNPGGIVQTGNTALFTNLPANTYSITVTDAAGCTTNPPISVTVIAGAPLTANASATATSCGGASNGTITITPNNGSAPYTFTLNPGGIIQTGNTALFTNLAATNYTISVTDASGCTTNPPVAVTVSAGPPLTATVSATPTSCSGASNGTINVTPNNGTAPYTFTLNPGGIIQTGNTALFTNLAANTYTVSVADASGCATNPPVSVSVNAGAPLTANVSATPTSCSGASNGTINVTPNNGSAPYTFTLNPGGIIQTGNTALFTNLAANTYTVNVTDASGCATNPPVSVTVVSGAPLTANVSATATSCDGASNGTITVTPNNGTAPYTFTLNPGGIIQTGNTALFSNLAANTYTVNVTDVSGCATNPPVSITVVAGAPLTANTSATATSCNGASNGTITVTPNNGTAPFTFSLDGGAPQSGPPPYVFNNVAPGMHSIIVTDASGCVTGSIPVDVPAGPNLSTTVAKTDVLCNGGATGTITVTQPAIGTPPFEYSINGGPWQTSNTFTGLIASTYTVSYREANGCQGSQTVNIDEPEVLDGSVSSIPVICNGQSNGTITVTVIGGVGPYQFSINGGANWQASPVFQVGAGSYTVLIRDANNCSISRIEFVSEPAVLTASATLTDASCDGGNDGTITINAAGGNSSYQYSINGGTFQSSNLFNVSPGLYTITVRDNLGCTTSFDTTVNLSGNLVLTPQTDPTICESQSVQLQVNSNATIYSWQASPSLNNLTIPNPVASPTVTTQFIVTVTLGNCSLNDTVIVNVNPAPIPDAGPPGLICYGQSYTLQGSGGTQFSWSPSNYLSSGNISNPVASPDATITYTLSVIDANGCSSVVSDDVTIEVTPPIKVYTFPYDTVAHPGDTFRILATSIAPRYQWSPSIGLSSDTISNPMVTIGNIGEDRVYKVTAYNAAGCKGEGYVRVRVFKGPDLYIPTAFTPNNDGKNDKFTPFPVGVKKINYFRVFNRWGQMIYSTNELHRGWDGTFGGKEQPSGVYVWMAEGVTLDNRVISHTGTVVLIR